jgi:hypothetical protein
MRVNTNLSLSLAYDDYPSLGGVLHGNNSDADARR